MISKRCNIMVCKYLINKYKWVKFIYEKGRCLKIINILILYNNI